QKEALQNDCCKSRLKKPCLSAGRNFENYSSRKLGKEFQRMKKDADKCCENFGSDFQKLMQALSEKLGKTVSDSCCVVNIMGVPDAIDVPKQYGNFNSGNEKIMIYWWRHWHDFLYFITENGKVKQVKWFFAYE
ncbi:MAG: hypothetical protein V1904_01470, partial [Bacteroidota bacterium]